MYSGYGNGTYTNAICIHNSCSDLFPLALACPATSLTQKISGVIDIEDIITLVDMEINRKRRRKDTLCVSNRHLRRLAAHESDIVSDILVHGSSLSCDDMNCKCTTDLNNDYRINSKLIDIKRDMECENNEIFIKYENVDTFSESDKSDLQRSSFNVSRDELSDLAFENENKSDFQDALATWAVEHRITPTALRELLVILKKHTCFSKLSLDGQLLLKTPRQQDNLASLNYKRDAQCAENRVNAEWHDNENVLNSIANPNIYYKGRSDFERYVVQKFHHLEVKISNLDKRQKPILEKISNTIELEEKEKIDIFQDLPLKDENDLKTMERKLGNDLFYRDEMIKQLARITSKDVKTSCVRLMRQMLLNEVAVLYSWYGAKKKENFSKLHVCQVIISVIRNCHRSVTDEQISDPIKIWLVHAKERMEREREREKEREREHGNIRHEESR